MKVLYDYQAFNQRVGGVSRYHYELLTRLLGYGVEPILPQIITDNIFIRDSNIPHWKATMFNRLGKYKPAAIAWLNQQICKYYAAFSSYDIFHATFVNPYYEKQAKGHPIVVTVHDLIHEKTQRHDSEKIKSRRIKQLLHADAIICVSNQTKDDLLNFYPQACSKDIRVIYHGCDNFDSQPPDYGPRLINSPYLLYVGTRKGYKNFDRFLMAYASISNDVSLVCTGNAFTVSEIDRIRQLGLEGKVHNRFVSDLELANLYHNAEAFVYPSLMEGFGLPILEAFKHKCPAIVSDIKCFHEVGGECAQYFNALDIDSISKTIDAVLESETLKQNMIENGQNRLEKFSWDESVRKHSILYRGFE